MIDRKFKFKWLAANFSNINKHIWIKYWSKIKYCIRGYYLCSLLNAQCALAYLFTQAYTHNSCYSCENMVSHILNEIWKRISIIECAKIAFKCQLFETCLMSSGPSQTEFCLFWWHIQHIQLVCQGSSFFFELSLVLQRPNPTASIWKSIVVLDYFSLFYKISITIDSFCKLIIFLSSLQSLRLDWIAHGSYIIATCSLFPLYWYSIHDLQWKTVFGFIFPRQFTYFQIFSITTIIQYALH